MDIKQSLTLNPLPDDIQEALRRLHVLHPTQTRIMVLHRIKGRSYGEIAAALHYQIDTCRHYDSWALRKLEGMI